MKPLYIILIGVVVLVVGILWYRSYKNNQAASQAATTAALAANSNNGVLAPGGSSQVAQIIASLFPYFKSVTSSSSDTSNSKPDPNLTPDVLPQKTVTLV